MPGSVPHRSISVLAGLLLTSSTGCRSAEVEDKATVDPPPGALVLSATAFDFGAVALHEVSAATLTLSNAGEGDLQIFDVSLVDDSKRAHWTLSGGRAGVLAPGDQTAVEITLRALDLNDPSVKLLIQSDDPDDPELTVPLSAEVYGEPEARVSPASLLELGTVAVGQSADGSISIANDGTADLTVEAATLTDTTGAFRVIIDPTGTVVRPHSEDGLLSIRFVPTTEGAHSASVIIVTDDADVPSLTVVVTGIGE